MSMKPLTPGTVTRALSAAGDVLDKAGDYSFSTRAKVVGFLTLGISSLVALAYKHFGGGAEDKTRAFVHSVPTLYDALFFSREEDGGYKKSKTITLDGMQVTFQEARGAEGNKKTIITFSTAQGEEKEEIENTSFEELLNKINKDVSENEEKYRRYISPYDSDHFNEFMDMYRYGKNANVHIYTRESVQNREDDRG